MSLPSPGLGTGVDARSHVGGRVMKRPEAPKLRFFRDRADAGRRLAGALSQFRRAHPLVLGLPHGGMPVAAELAESLGGDLDVVLARDLRCPPLRDPSIGAVGEHGLVEMNTHAQGCLADADTVRAELAYQREYLRELRRRYATYRAPAEAKGRLALVVTDGVLGGARMKVALKQLRAEGAARLVAVAPVAPLAVLAELKPWADEVVVLLAPARMGRVEDFYEDFPELGDEDVRTCIARLRRGFQP